ncbi:MAG TPA: hypothetical protein VG733_19980 [Chthoniobacteraceae bacterium]|nr:hypothetical protein [Chthoniobacteraceae bacterium]
MTRKTIATHIVPTLFSDPATGRELMRRIVAPRESWWRRLRDRRLVRIRRSRLGGIGRETVISERIE